MSAPNPNDAPTPLDLRGALPFQEHAIVSRVLAKNTAGTATLFAFDAGEGLSEHTAPFDALVVGLEGRATVEIDHVPHPLGALESIVLPANIPHAIRTEERFRMLLVMLRA